MRGWVRRMFRGGELLSWGDEDIFEAGGRIKF